MTSAAQRDDPTIVRVHSHEDGVLVEYVGTVIRYESIEFVPLLD